MCSTHNPRKHYFAVREKICVRFTFVNQDSLQRSFMIDVSQFQEAGSVQIVKALLHLESKGFNVDKYQVCLPQFDNMILNMEQNFLIPFEKLPKKQFFFHLTRKNNENFNNDDGEKVKQKQSQRYIGDVIEKVKHWRGLFQKKKISLKEAALVVGIPKKSLDDYYLLLRQGQILSFQFDKNLQNKMGQLRSFIKKNSKKLPSGKLSEEINNLKCYTLVVDFQDKKIKQKDQQIEMFSKKIGKMDLDEDCEYGCNQFDSDQN